MVTRCRLARPKFLSSKQVRLRQPALLYGTHSGVTYRSTSLSLSLSLSLATETRSLYTTAPTESRLFQKLEGYDGTPPCFVFRILRCINCFT